MIKKSTDGGNSMKAVKRIHVMAGRLNNQVKFCTSHPCIYYKLFQNNLIPSMGVSKQITLSMVYVDALLSICPIPGQMDKSLF